MIDFFRRHAGHPRAVPDTLAIAVDRIRTASDLADLVRTLAEVARGVVGSDGATVVRRVGDSVEYVGEDAISPLWAGQRFPIRTCVSGQAMLARAAIAIPDISTDRRVPLNAYLATFVRSMVLVPVGDGDPEWAIGAYWRDCQPIGPIAVDRLSALAAAAADALVRIEGPRPPAAQVA